MIPDAVRFTLAALSLVLAVTCGGGIIYASGWDQRSRFAVLLGYSVIITSGQLDNLTTPPSWRTWALLIVTVAAVISTAAFLIRHVRRARGGPDDGRPANHKRDLLRPRPTPRGGGRAGDRAGPTGGRTET
jgi:TRAP-type C4-dicarboxylate transport system permease small subunit